MLCKQAQTLLQDHLDQLLDFDENQDLMAHLENCDSCRQRLQQEQAWRAELQDLPLPPMTSDFGDRVLAQAKAQRPKGGLHGHSFLLGFGSAIAAGLALWVVTLLFVVGPDTQPADPLKTVNIVLHETTKVKLAFDSPRELGNVRVSLLLPQHVELDGFPGQTRISWNTDLRQGRNMLALPIRATQVSLGKLEARIEHEGKTRSISIGLQVNEPGVSGAVHDSEHLV